MWQTGLIKENDSKFYTPYNMITTEKVNYMYTNKPDIFYFNMYILGLRMIMNIFRN